MKRKKVNKKLTLNKNTIAHVADDYLNNARGGVSLNSVCCPDYPPTTAPPNTEYYTCVDQSCVCTDGEYTCDCSWLPTCGIFCF